MKYIIVVLLSALFAYLSVQTAPVNKVAKVEAKAETVQVVAPEKVTHTLTEQKTKATPEKQATVKPKPEPMQPSTHVQLMAAAGIQPEDYGAADYIISHESNWNPNATEPTTGAHGLPQALPYSKTDCGWSDELCQLRWANSYAVARYGGWWQAQAYWVEHRNW